MASLESINELLKTATEHLAQAVDEIHELLLDPSNKHIRAIGGAIANILQIQREIYRLRPDLEPIEEAPEPDGDLTSEEMKLVTQLTEEQAKTIDEALLQNTCDQWRKVARVVGTTMTNVPFQLEGIPDIYYSKRVQKLVEDGLLESQGNLSFMRFSEVRRPKQ